MESGRDAQRVRALRSVLGVSQEQLAQQLQVSFATVNRWERGHHAMSGAAKTRFDLLEAGLGAAEPVPGGMPIPRSSLIGRAREIAQVGAALLESRLLTLWGPVGVGKSRLAIAVGEKFGTRARYLSGRQTDPAGFTVLLSEALASNAEVIVVDDIDEHCGDVRRLLDDLLRRRAAPRILVTSQQPVGLAGERLWPIAALTSAAAETLFVERARHHEPHFSASASLIAAVCEGCAGLPLAIESMAAWVGTLTVAEIVEQQSLLLGMPPPIDADPGERLGAFQDAVDASYVRLDGRSQQLVQTLSVFAGSFSLDDVVEVADLAQQQLVVALHRIRLRSWITVEVAGDLTTYRIPAPMRPVATRRLKAAGVVTERSVRNRHARHFTALARRSESELVGAERVEWVARMTRAEPDLGAALAWTIGAGDRELGLELATSLWLWWLTTGRLAEGRRWLARFSAAVAFPPPELAARASCSRAVLAVEAGDYDGAIVHARLAFDGFTTLSDPDGQARSATVLGSAERYAGRYDEARSHFEVAMRCRREHGDDRGLATALNNLALAALDTGDLDASRRTFEESLLVKRRLREPRTVAIGLANLSEVLIRAGHISQAEAALFEAAGIAVDLGDTQLLATIACNLGDAAHAHGNDQAAVAHYETSLAEHRSAAGAHDLVPALLGLARSLHALDRTSEAVIRLRESESLANTNANENQLLEIRRELARMGHDTTIVLPDGITPRQAQILRLVASGAANKHIATALQIRLATVERHLATIYSKLGLSSRVDAARYALDHGLATSGRAERQLPAQAEYMTVMTSGTNPAPK